MKRRRYLALMLTALATSAVAAPTRGEEGPAQFQTLWSVPFRLQVRVGTTHQMSYATLNQDGSWTFKGNPEAARGDFFGDVECILDGLVRVKPPNNPAPDNSRRFSQAESDAVICASPVTRPCIPLFGRPISCEALISLR